MPSCADAGVNQTFMLQMWGTGGTFDIAARTATRIDQLRCHEVLKSSTIKRQALRLDDWTFIPIQAKPLQVAYCLLVRPLLDARRIDVLNAQHHSAALTPRG